MTTFLLSVMRQHLYSVCHIVRGQSLYVPPPPPTCSYTNTRVAPSSHPPRVLDTVIPPETLSQNTSDTGFWTRILSGVGGSCMWRQADVLVTPGVALGAHGADWTFRVYLFSELCP